MDLILKVLKGLSRKCEYILLLIIFLFFLGWGYTLSPETETDRQVDAYFFEGLRKAEDVDYLGGLESMRKIVDLVPEHPAGHLFSTAVLSWIISDFYNYKYAEEFLSEVDKTIELSKKMIQINRLNPWGYIYLGGAYGFRGIYYSTIGSFYFAFLDGVRGNYELQKAISLNSEIYDNYFGTGTFDFWKAYYSGKFFWLGNADRNKQTGIDKIHLAIAKGKYTTLEAEFSLIRIYLVDGRYQDAIDQAKKLLSVSPQSIKARRFMGIAYRELQQYDKSLETFLEMKKTIEKHELKTPAAILGVNINIARAYEGKGKSKDALTLLENSKVYYNRIEYNNDFLEDLKDEYDRLIAEIRVKTEIKN